MTWSRELSGGISLGVTGFLLSRVSLDQLKALEAWLYKLIPYPTLVESREGVKTGSKSEQSVPGIGEMWMSCSGLTGNLLPIHLDRILEIFYSTLCRVWFCVFHTSHILNLPWSQYGGSVSSGHEHKNITARWNQTRLILALYSISRRSGALTWNVMSMTTYVTQPQYWKYCKLGMKGAQAVAMRCNFNFKSGSLIRVIAMNALVLVLTSRPETGEQGMRALSWVGTYKDSYKVEDIATLCIPYMLHPLIGNYSNSNWIQCTSCTGAPECVFPVRISS